jgi:hypothetical protein
MKQSDPEATFTEAQSAMLRGDWAAFFTCFAESDLLIFASNSVNNLLAQGQQGWEVLLQLCDTYAIPAHQLEAVRLSGNEIITSVHAITVTPGVNIDAIEMTDPSISTYSAAHHQQLVNDYDVALKRMLTSATSLPDLTAALEQQMRLMLDGGSVSHWLFIDESLHDIVIKGGRAWGTRVIGNDWEEDIGFVRKRGQWYIKLMAKKPKRLRLKSHS